MRIFLLLLLGASVSIARTLLRPDLMGWQGLAASASITTALVLVIVLIKEDW